MKTKQKVLFVRLNNNMYAEVVRYKKKLGITKAAAVRIILNNFFKKEK